MSNEPDASDPNLPYFDDLWHISSTTMEPMALVDWDTFLPKLD